MEKFYITKIAKDLGVTHGAVSQWFRAKTIPKYKYMIKMSENFSVPLSAWDDIKTFLTTNESLSESEKKLKSTKRKNSTKEETC